MATIIIHGPRACGKTRNAQALAVHFNAASIVDDYDPAMHAVVRNAIHLTTSPGPFPKGIKAVSFESIGFDASKSKGVARLPGMSAAAARQYLRSPNAVAALPVKS